MVIRMGALAPPLKDQILDPIPEKELERLQRAADSVTYLNCHGLLNDSITRAVRKRIIRELEKAAPSSEDKEPT